jgi:uncharacterized membrane protein HdeD (DUF308 family)
MATNATGLGLGSGLNHLAKRWWALALRGVLAILFGIACFWLPAAAMLSLVLLFAVYAIADGIAELAAAIGAARADQSWWLLALEGVVSLGAGIAAVLLPGLTVLVFVIVIAVRAAIGGVLLLMSAAKLEDHRIWMILAGLASIVLAVALIMAPVVGAVVLTWWIGAYAFAFGVLMLVLAFRLKARLR